MSTLPAFSKIKGSNSLEKSRTSKGKKSTSSGPGNTGNHIIHIFTPSSTSVPTLRNLPSAPTNPHTPSFSSEGRGTLRSLLLAQSAACTNAHIAHAPLSSSKSQRTSQHARTAPDATAEQLAQASFGTNLLALRLHKTTTPILEPGLPISSLSLAAPMHPKIPRSWKRPRINSGNNVNKHGFSSSLLDVAGISASSQHDSQSGPHAFMPSSGLHKVPPVIPKKRKPHIPQEVRFALSGPVTMYQHIGDASLPLHGPLLSSLEVAQSVNHPGSDDEYMQPGWEPNTNLEDAGFHIIFPSDQAAPHPATRRKRRSKAEIRSATAKRWNEVIPSLVVPYSRIMAMTQRGRVPNSTHQRSTCKKLASCGALKKLTVTCVYGKSESCIILICHTRSLTYYHRFRGDRIRDLQRLLPRCTSAGRKGFIPLCTSISYASSRNGSSGLSLDAFHG
jgi:hypothetical protein